MRPLRGVLEKDGLGAYFRGNTVMTIIIPAAETANEKMAKRANEDIMATVFIVGSVSFGSAMFIYCLSEFR